MQSSESFYSKIQVIEIPSSSSSQQKKYLIPNTSGFDGINSNNQLLLSDDVSQQTKQAFHSIVKAFQHKIPNFTISWIEHMNVTVRNEEDYSKCLSILMKEFNYHLPSCKLQTSFEGGLQDQVLVQLQAVCSVPSSSSSLSESEKNELISNTESDTTRITRFHVGNRYSESAVYGNVLYISGQVPDDDGKKDIEGQTEEVLAALDQRLKEAGTDKTKLLMVQIFLASMSDFDGMNQVWDQWVPKGHAPPRATVEAKLARSYWRIEIVATAAL